VKIDLTELLHKVGNEADIEQTEQVSFPEDQLNLTKPLKMNVHLVNTGESVLVTGKAETEVELECSRCLKSFKQPVLIEIDEEYTRNPFIPKGGKEIELKAEDFASPIEKDNTIDLTELIRQDILLNLPVQPLCSPGCKGIKGEE
jgi:uncharacterized protein